MGNADPYEAELVNVDDNVTFCGGEYEFDVEVPLVTIDGNLVSPNIAATADGDAINCELKSTSCQADGNATHECTVPPTALRGESSITVEVKAQLASQVSRQINTFNLRSADAGRRCKPHSEYQCL